MAELASGASRSNLKVLRGNGPATSVGERAGLAPALGREGGRFLRVLTTEWTFLGRVQEFPVHQPKVTLLDQVRTGRPVYVVRLGGDDFAILDMKTGGYYEYRIEADNLYIRRLVPRAI